MLPPDKPDTVSGRVPRSSPLGARGVVKVAVEAGGDMAAASRVPALSSTPLPHAPPALPPRDVSSMLRLPMLPLAARLLADCVSERKMAARKPPPSPAGAAAPRGAMNAAVAGRADSMLAAPPPPSAALLNDA